MFIIIAPGASFAQCAMCRATLENNLSNGNVGIAAGINFGILYLFGPLPVRCVNRLSLVSNQ